MFGKTGALVAGALALVTAPAFAQQQQSGQQHQQGRTNDQQQKMTPMPIDTGGRSMEELFSEGKESTVPLGNVPNAAQQTIKMWSQGGKLDKVEKQTLKDGRVFYQAHIDKGGQTLEVIVTPEGQTVRAGEETGD